MLWDVRATTRSARRLFDRLSAGTRTRAHRATSAGRGKRQRRQRYAKKVTFYRVFLVTGFHRTRSGWPSPFVGQQGKLERRTQWQSSLKKEVNRRDGLSFERIKTPNIRRDNSICSSVTRQKHRSIPSQRWFPAWTGGGGGE